MDHCCSYAGPSGGAVAPGTTMSQRKLLTEPHKGTFTRRKPPAPPDEGHLHPSAGDPGDLHLGQPGPVGVAVGEGLLYAARMRIALCQIPVSADPKINFARVRTALAEAAGQDGDGSLVSAYRKIHLFDALGQRESDLVAPGAEPVVTDLAGLRVGFLTCYDIRFPELARVLVDRGAELIVVPAAWGAGLFKEEHWVTLTRARAIENTVWVATADQVPDPAEPSTRAPTGIGRSMLIDPMGTVRVDLGPYPGVAVADVDTKLTAQVRTSLPCLEHRREDVFGPLPPQAPRFPD